MKVGIMGAGAIGCYVGGRLTHAGVPTVLVGRAALKQELDEHGLHLSDFRGDDVHLRGIDIQPSAEALAECGVVLVTVKGGDTASVGRTLAPILGPQAIVVSLQNGVRNPEILRRELSSTVLGAMVPFNVLRKDGGRFHQGTSGTLVIEDGAGAAAVAALLTRAKIRVKLDRAIDEVLWGKLVVNLSNAVNALAGVPIKEMLASRAYRRIMASCVREGVLALRRAGIRPRPDLVLPVPFVARALEVPDGLFRILSRAMPHVDPEARASMWDDLMRGRKTEVDALNGEIVALAARVGTAAPVNTAIVRLIHEAEALGCPPNLGPDALTLKVRGG